MPSDVDIILPDNLTSLTEAQYQKLIIEMAGYCGYTEWYHTRFSMKSRPGFPDLVLFNPDEGGSVYFEVKNEKQAFTKEQKRWLQVIRSSGIHAYGVRPRHAELVVGVLRGIHVEPTVGTGHPDHRLIPICPEPEGGFPWE